MELASKSKKRSFDEVVEEFKQGAEDPVPDTSKDDVDQDGHVTKRTKSEVPETEASTPTPTAKTRTMSIGSSAADRTAAARAASAAKRAAALRRGGRGGRSSTVGTLSKAVFDSDVKQGQELGVEAADEDHKMTDETEEIPKTIPRRKPGKKRRGFVVKRRQSGRRNSIQQEDEDKDETADEDTSTVESETAVPLAADGDEDVSDMEVDGTPPPKGRSEVGGKRKRAASSPPPSGEPTVVPAPPPKLSSVTPLAPPPPPLFQTKSDSSTTSSSLSNIIASPSPVFAPPKPISTVGQQVQVIATKKFQQLSTPLLHNISAHRFANLFMAPVGERVAPGYSKLVFRPMDLKSMLQSDLIISLPTLTNSFSPRYSHQSSNKKWSSGCKPPHPIRQCRVSYH